MKRALVIAAILIESLFLVQSRAYAQAANSNNELLSGFYAFHTAGEAQLSAPISGSCAATGLVAAGLDGSVFFDGHGNFTQGNTAVSIGATSCSSPNYSIFGTYNVTGRDANSFAATGTLSTRFQGRPAACSGTGLSNVSFSLIGTIVGRSITITTYGTDEGSTYAEGPPAGPLTCTATILNFITSGEMTRNP
jgi:hypothetical protein